MAPAGTGEQKDDEDERQKTSHLETRPTSLWNLQRKHTAAALLYSRTGGLRRPMAQDRKREATSRPS